MALTPFRDYYLIEAVDLDRTWKNYGEAVVKRASTPQSWSILAKVHGGVSHHVIGSLRPNEYEREKITPDHINDIGHHTITSPAGLKKLKVAMGPMINNAPGARDTDEMIAIPQHDTHMVATILRQPKPPASDGPISKALAETSYHDDVKRDAFMEHVQKSVPHPKYIPTVTRMYAEGGIKRMEDIDSQAAEVIGKYHTLATHGRLDPQRQVVDSAAGKVYSVHPDEYGSQEELEKNRRTAKMLNPEARDKPIPETNFKAFKSLDDFRAVVDHERHSQFFASERKSALKGSYDVVHDDEHVTVYHPKTYEAAKALSFCPHSGKKAAWCTAADSKSGEGYFNDYHSDGPLLIFHPKQPKHPGEMYQAHAPVGYSDSRRYETQTMDEHDHDSDFAWDGSNLPPEERHRFKERFPGITHDWIHEKSQDIYNERD